MKAGRELDAEVAEKVMGAYWTERENVCRILWNAEGVEMVLEEWYEKDWVPSTAPLPCYSTQIADAWLVVMHFKDRQYGVSLEGEDGFDWSRWDFRIWNPFDDPDTADEMAHGWDESRDLNERIASAPLSICLAALKAVGQDIPCQKSQS